MKKSCLHPLFLVKGTKPFTVIVTVVADNRKTDFRCIASEFHSTLMNLQPLIVVCTIDFIQRCLHN